MKKIKISPIAKLLILLPLAIIPSFLCAQSPITANNETEINTDFQEYSPAFYKNGIVFIGSNPAVTQDKKTDDETGKKATSFFLAMQGENGALKKIVPFAEELTTKFYDGPLSFSADGNTVYFTRNNLRRGKPQKSKDGLVKLKIYSAEKTETGWVNITDMPLNIPHYDCAHPSVSRDGKRLYFASNRPDGFGGMDLYVCTLINGKWSIPVNLGPKVNSTKNEVFPFIHADGTLYFASNRREDYGNLDIFCTVKTDTGWMMPKVLPEPINSPSDDFGIIVSTDKKSGYFSSNRASGKGDDDILSFNAPDGIDTPVYTESEASTPQQIYASTQIKPTKAIAILTNLSTIQAPALLIYADIKDAATLKSLIPIRATPSPLETVKSDMAIENKQTTKPTNIKKDKKTAVIETKPTLETLDLEKDKTKLIVENKPALEPLKSESTLTTVESINMPTSQQLNPEKIKTDAFLSSQIPAKPFHNPKQPLLKLEQPTAETNKSEFAEVNETKELPTEHLIPGVKEETLFQPSSLKLELNKVLLTTELKEQNFAKETGIKIEASIAAPAASVVKSEELMGKSQKKYLVVVGTYSLLKNAIDQQKKAMANGYGETAVIHYTDNHLYGVAVRQSDDEKEAQTLARNINKSKSMEAFVKVLK